MIRVLNQPPTQVRMSPQELVIFIGSLISQLTEEDRAKIVRFVISTYCACGKRLVTGQYMCGPCSKLIMDAKQE